MSINYAPNKINAESIDRLPFNWRENLPKKGWRIFSEAEASGRREITVQLSKGLLTYRGAQPQGKEFNPSNKAKGERLLSDEQLNEALSYVNTLWATNPVLSGAHRTRLKHQVTLILTDGDTFKAFSSADPGSEIHRFNEQLWSWASMAAAK